MPEAATTEAPIAEPVEVAAAPVEEAPPNPEPETAQVEGTEGGDSTETEGSAPDYSAVEAELEAEVERRVQERASKVEAEAEKRGKQRTKEADDGESARVALYTTAKAEAGRNAQALRQIAQSGDVLDTETLDKHMNAVMAGVTAIAAEHNEAAIKALIETALPDQTEAEQEELDPLIYDFRRNGRFDTLPAKVTELALARKDAEIADLRKQLKDRASVVSAAEKLAKAREAAGPGIGAETPLGRVASVGPLTLDEANTLSIEELKRRTSG